MKLLFLRGQVPQDRDPAEICHACACGEDDVWTWLAMGLGDEQSELVYWGGKRYISYNDKFSIRWVKNLAEYECPFKPDVIFARGGFPEYEPVLRRYAGAYKIYYGAGKRYKPEGYQDYNLILTDSVQQQKNLNQILKEKSALWVKPAAPLFYPTGAEKRYDVGYVADGRFEHRAKIKGVDFVYSTIPDDLSLLHLGWAKKNVRKHSTIVRVNRTEMPGMLSECRVGIIPYTDYDSAPRCLPEMLACDVPVVVSDRLNIWREMYVNEHTGAVANKDNFWETVRRVMSLNLKPAAYYKEHLSLDAAVRRLKGLISGAKSN